ncbi:type II toxin-antitoxin system CcdA family antitoxin [Hyphomicrobium sp.]|uniref:type II toxin-antitoxin system CcdA family antitoxin n=1 Tax=Hyphomicrobium sp. TaxID=82 RepID=UPI0025C6FD68|nr:type II toxin-antitoxin system CcdA family antitoxin [Hyphomicrobium sp.]MCC7252650.1 type II toxin-antitoxin system CcdA family antitoxin [Hyphomicrobium sp.]
MQERPNRRKRAVNLSIDADLLAEAREAGTNLSALLEEALARDLQERRSEKWRQENRKAIQSHNRFIRKHGLLSDDWRKF